MLLLDYLYLGEDALFYIQNIQRCSVLPAITNNQRECVTFS